MLYHWVRWLFNKMHLPTIGQHLDLCNDVQRLSKDTCEELTRQRVELSQLARRLEMTYGATNLRLQLMAKRLLWEMTDESLSRRVKWGPAASLLSVRHLNSEEETVRLFESKAPAAYRVWRALFSENEKAYEGSPPDSCSVDGHEVAEKFRHIVNQYACGLLLDIGCGPQYLPRYLADYPVESVVGVDPLGPSQGHPFRFFKSFAEQLPFEGAQFDSVIAATSLDHVLLPDVAIAEIARVMKGDGILLVWVSFVRDAEPYDPYQQLVKAVDRYHLFHFSRNSFMQLLGRHFELADEIPVDQLSHFVVFRKRNAD